MTDLQNTYPLIMPLAYNGGETLTHSLKLFSLAVDRGDNAVCQAPPVSNLDQRDVERPIDGDNDMIFICDNELLVVGDVIMIKGRDGSFDTTVVFPNSPTATATFTPTPTKTTTPTATTPNDYLYFLPLIKKP